MPAASEPSATFITFALFFLLFVFLCFLEFKSSFSLFCALLQFSNLKFSGGKIIKNLSLWLSACPRNQLSVTTDLFIYLFILFSELMVRSMPGILATNRNPEKTFASHSRLYLLGKRGGNVLCTVA